MGPAWRAWLGGWDALISKMSIDALATSPGRPEEA